MTKLFSEKHQEQLHEGLLQLGLNISLQQEEKLLAFAELLYKWNQVYNLTAVTEPSQIIIKHLLDSLAIWPYLKGQVWLDVGTGAGLPGIPLALVYPEKNLLLLDSLGKRTRFLQQIVYQLGLKNVIVINARVEMYQPQQKIDQIISRAFSSLEQFLQAVAHLSCEKGEILALKGENVNQELANIPADQKWRVHPLTIPGLNLNRYVVVIKRD